MSSTANIQNLLKEVDSKKHELDTYRPLPPELIKNLNEWYRVELAYSSNALEGNTLTSSETAIVIEKGLTIGGKTLKEHLEAINHAYAFDFILDLAKNPVKNITLRDIYSIHCLILRDIDSENAGQLRKILVRITGLNLVLPDPVKQLPELMDEFLAWLHTTQEHPILRAADAHLKLVTIHPFIEGNGRTARLLMNLLLIQAGYPPALIMPEQRAAYIDALALAQTKNILEPYHEFILQCVARSLDTYLLHARSTIS